MFYLQSSWIVTILISTKKPAPHHIDRWVFWCKVAQILAVTGNSKQRKENVPLIALDVYTVEVFGHCHENFLIWAATPGGDLFNTNTMDVSTCSSFSWDGYAASRSHIMDFEEEYLTGKSEEVLLRKTLAQHNPSLGYLSIEWKMNQKQQVKAQWKEIQTKSL